MLPDMLTSNLSSSLSAVPYIPSFHFIFHHSVRLILNSNLLPSSICGSKPEALNPKPQKYIYIYIYVSLDIRIYIYIYIYVYQGPGLWGRQGGEEAKEGGKCDQSRPVPGQPIDCYAKLDRV